MLRRRRRQPSPTALVDALPPRWRAPVAGAADARDRFAAVAGRTAAGPLRDRLDAMAAQLDAGVQHALATARRAHETETAVAALDVGDVGARLKRARRHWSELPEGSPERRHAAEEVALLAEQFSTLNRVHNRLDETAAELVRLELRLETAVARAVELTLSPNAAPVDPGIDAVVADLAALQAALDDLGPAPR
jgi:hypothetical protein